MTSAYDLEFILMKRWKTKSREIVIKDRWIALRADTCELPNGQVIAPFYVLEEREWVHVVAVDAGGLILLTRQYRYAADVVSTELPCGMADDGEEPVETARRELREETGYVAEEWVKVSALFANPARQTNRIHCFLARGLRKAGEQVLDISEDIAFEFASAEEVMRRIGSGEFCQAHHVASYLMAMRALEAEGAGESLLEG
jgi:8-oxo-dGTP pyrophosphatase MutT (NUDIX family)